MELPDARSEVENEPDKTEREGRVLAAIKNSTYVWRTVEGLAKDTGLSDDQVDEILSKSDKFIRARRSNHHGQALYSTREKYEADAGIRERLLSAITNKLGG